MVTDGHIRAPAERALALAVTLPALADVGPALRMAVDAASDARPSVEMVGAMVDLTVEEADVLDDGDELDLEADPELDAEAALLVKAVYGSL